MISPDASVVIGTYREGGIDLVLSSLANQDTALKYEVVLADELYPERRKEVAKLAKKLKLEVKHVPAIPYPHFSAPETYNTGLKAATGEIVIIGSDFARYPPNYIAENARVVREHQMSVCVSCYQDRLPDSKNQPEGDFTRREDRLGRVTRWIEPNLGLVPDVQYCLGLIAAPREAFIACNGYNEGEFGRGSWGYDDFYLNMGMLTLGYRHLLNTEIIVTRLARQKDPNNPETGSTTLGTKTATRTNEESQAVAKQAIFELLSGIRIPAGHEGLEDLRWRNRKVLIDAGGAWLHGQNISKMFRKAGLRVNSMRPGFGYEFNVYVVFGVSPGDVARCAEFKAKGIKTVLWFTGTDSRNLLNQEIGERPIFGMPVEQVQEAASVILAGCDRNQLELKKVGIKAPLVPVPVNDWNEKLRRPELFRVLCYWQTDLTDVWEEAPHIETIKLCPDVKFIVIGKKPSMKLPKNAEYLGWVDEAQERLALSQCSVFLRFLKNDATGGALRIKCLQRGMWSLGYWKSPWCVQIKGPKDAAKWILAYRKRGCPVNGEAAKYYRHAFSTKVMVDGFVREVLRR